MNARQLEKLGVPAECVKSAILAIQSASRAGMLRELNVKQLIAEILACPSTHTADAHFGQFAQAVVDSGDAAEPREPISYRTWGESGIDAASHTQMRQACALPMATGAALMPDAHVGYGLPIGGVLALEGAQSGREAVAFLADGRDVAELADDCGALCEGAFELIFRAGERRGEAGAVDDVRVFAAAEAPLLRRG